MVSTTRMQALRELVLANNPHLADEIDEITDLQLLILVKASIGSDPTADPVETKQMMAFFDRLIEEKRQSATKH
ncbi:hypothetical protein [Pseudomonas sp. M47T1]|uniref:hypothetical protein n=1 Tax=Pseudomonas sp. M47T1 TaxID=1179778 RepID=UPI0012FABBD8|nr:hypothetical protein [Pseudomonas sp. M47T1]